MVARGDLGVEMPLEKVPGLQKQITRAARRAGKPVVVATQMLESMITAPVPTRAEVSDVATAIFEGADAVMLSAESAAGQFPVEAVATMNRIAEEVESDDTYHTIIKAQRAEPEATGADAIAAAARQIAETLDLSAIVCWTFSGSTGLRVARERPQVPIVALSPNVATGRKLVGGLGHPLHRHRGRARSRRHGGARLPARLQGRLRQGRPPRHHRRRRAARHAGRDQHAAHRLRRLGDGGLGRVLRVYFHRSDLALGAIAGVAFRLVQKQMTAVSKTAEMAVAHQSAIAREAPADRNRAMSMSPISVPQVLHVATAIQYQALLRPNR